MPARCPICKEHPREVACQPFGPDDKIVFMALGAHYRGFPVFGLCRYCEDRIRRGEPVTVTYKGHSYTIQHHQETR